MSLSSRAICIDFAVAKRWEERKQPNFDRKYQGYLAAVRFPEDYIVFDNAHSLCGFDTGEFGSVETPLRHPPCGKRVKAGYKPLSCAAPPKPTGNPKRRIQQELQSNRGDRHCTFVNEITGTNLALSLLPQLFAFDGVAVTSLVESGLYRKTKKAVAAALSK